MTNKNAKIFIFELSCCMLLFACCTCTTYAQPLSAEQLISQAKAYDGKTVTFRGEVIGDVMARKDFAWVNVHDGAVAIGVWMPRTLTQIIALTGSYKSKGDIIEVTGLFNRACLEHGGDLDIHAQAVQKITDGRLLSRRLSPDKTNLALGLGVFLLLLWILTRLKTK
ncbi:MAG: DNA-binding protein [Candidatus Omnitrophica bacterium]|nr:DNA-binding protein [Candidatus Omnitrophota bacterium]